MDQETPEGWTYYRWPESEPVRLVANDILQTTPGSKAGEPLHHLIRYADMSYLSCRILMISSEEVHPPALYMAGQTVEKYLKALLQKFAGTYRWRHPLTELAEEVHGVLTDKGSKDAGLFNDPEFVALCEQLQEFDIAGRYQPERIASWHYYLNILGFLDAFVVKCREIIGVNLDSTNVVRDLLLQDTTTNEVMAAAVRAVRDRNRHVEALLNPGSAT